MKWMTNLTQIQFGWIMRLFKRFAKFTKERYKKAHIGTKNEMPISLEEVRDLKTMIGNNLQVSFK